MQIKILLFLDLLDFNERMMIMLNWRWQIDECKMLHCMMFVILSQSICWNSWMVHSLYILPYLSLLKLPTL